MGFLNTILKYFIQGIALLVPLAITVFIFVNFFQFFQNLFSFVGLTGNSFLDTLISLIFLIILITVFGILASSFVFKNIFLYFENRLEHAPFIRHIYSPIKDFMNAFTGNKKKFTKPVLILTNPQANIQEMGFITQDTLTDLGIQEKIAVYLPYSYSFSGRLIIVSASQVTPLNIEGSDAMKFIISGGVTDVDKD